MSNVDPGRLDGDSGCAWVLIVAIVCATIIALALIYARG